MKYEFVLYLETFKFTEGEKSFAHVDERARPTGKNKSSFIFSTPIKNLFLCANTYLFQ